MTLDREELTYKGSGVDVQKGYELVDKIKQIAPAIGGFAGLHDLSKIKKYNHPMLVQATDGVGTKLKIAIEKNDHSGIGQDLVAMCINDLLTVGAKPLTFLDYYATGKLDVDVAAAVIESIKAGCDIAGCELIGGETAELPGLYHGSDYDIAGFATGVVEKDRIIDGSFIRPGDLLYGMRSSGFHSNGYSLLRQLRERFADPIIEEALLIPTRIYTPEISLLKQYQVSIRGMSHITGGGINENIPRMLPENVSVLLDREAFFCEDSVYKTLRQYITTDEMLRTFNCGIGMVFVVPQEMQYNMVIADSYQFIPLGTVIDKPGRHIHFDGENTENEKNYC